MLCVMRIQAAITAIKVHWTEGPASNAQHKTFMMMTCAESLALWSASAAQHKMLHTSGAGSCGLSCFSACKQTSEMDVSNKLTRCMESCPLIDYVCVSAAGSLKMDVTLRKAAMSVIRGMRTLVRSRELAVLDFSPHAGR